MNRSKSSHPKLSKWTRGVVLAFTLVFASWFGATTAEACPGCQTQGELVILQEPETVTASMALSWSVLFLLVVLGGVGGFLGVYIRNTVARVDAANQRS